MLMDTDLDVSQLDYVRTAQASGKALVALINEVLDLAKIESGKLELEEVQFDLRAVLDDVLSLFSGKSQDKGVEVRFCISVTHPILSIPFSPHSFSLSFSFTLHMVFIQECIVSILYNQFVGECSWQFTSLIKCLRC